MHTTRQLPPGPGPLVMGVLNASSESFSGGVVGPDDAVAAAAAMCEAGAHVLDIGAQSLRTDQDEIDVELEIARMVSVLDPIRRALPEVAISVDTYRHQVAEVAVAHGATMLNDPSGLSDDRLADVVAKSGVHLVVTYNRARPKQRLRRDELVADPVQDCVDFVGERVRRLLDEGVDPAQLVFDPGPDLGKSPDQTIEVLRAMTELRERIGVPRVLWALSRKDFIGALLRRRPAGRWPGTLGAMSALDVRDGDVLRVHDVQSTVDFFAVRRALIDGVEGPLELPVELRHDE